MRHKSFFILLGYFFFCFCDAANAQSSTTANTTIDIQVKNIMEWYKKDVLASDSSSAVLKLQQARDKYQKDGGLLYEYACFYMQLYKVQRVRGYPGQIALWQEAVTWADEHDLYVMKATCWHYMGGCYYELGKFGPAFEYMQKAQNLLTEKGYGKFPFIKFYADALAECYYRFGDFRQAILFLQQSRLLPEYWKSVVYAPAIRNNLGLCYQQLKLYDSAAVYFKESHREAARYKDSFYMALADGNLGYTYFLSGNDSAALPLLLEDYKASIKAKEWGSASNAAMTLATLSVKKGLSAQADEYLQFAKKYVYQGNDVRVYKIWYNNLYLLSRIKGDYKSMAMYADSLLLYKDSVQQQQSQKTLHQAQLKLETEQHLHKIAELESYSQKQLMLRNLWLLILLLVGVIGFLWLNRQRLKRKKELETSALEKENARQQLAFAQQELLVYTNKLKEKNELIESFRTEIAGIQENEQHVQSERTKHLTQLLNASILTEDDWKTFRELFEKVHTGFFARLRDQLPDLTPADTRLLTLIKLNLTGKEIAAMLGITYEAVKKARQRLRKKIELSQAMGLEDIINEL
jgi:DNA-binding CsgD family transcriptional regulator